MKERKMRKKEIDNNYRIHSIMGLSGRKVSTMAIIFFSFNFFLSPHLWFLSFFLSFFFPLFWMECKKVYRESKLFNHIQTDQFRLSAISSLSSFFFLSSFSLPSSFFFLLFLHFSLSPHSLLLNKMRGEENSLRGEDFLLIKWVGWEKRKER